jgi:hypothetical protein
MHTLQLIKITLISRCLCYSRACKQSYRYYSNLTLPLPELVDRYFVMNVHHIVSICWNSATQNRNVFAIDVLSNIATSKTSVSLKNQRYVYLKLRYIICNSLLPAMPTCMSTSQVGNFFVIQFFSPELSPFYMFAQRENSP